MTPLLYSAQHSGPELGFNSGWGGEGWVDEVMTEANDRLFRLLLCRLTWVGTAAAGAALPIPIGVCSILVVCPDNGIGC